MTQHSFLAKIRCRFLQHKAQVTDPNNAQPPRHGVIKRPRFNREQGVVAAKVKSLAACSVLILQVNAAVAAATRAAAASVAASRRCSLLLGAAAASARNLAAKVLVYATTTPCSRLNLALVVAVELSQSCWPGWLWRYEHDRMPSRSASSVDMGLQYICRPARIWNKSLPDFIYLILSFVVLLGRGRRGQRRR